MATPPARWRCPIPPACTTASAALLPPHFFCDLPDDEAAAARSERLLERHADEIAGIIVEPLVQGAGGMQFPRCRRAAPAARACGPLRRLLLIFDEIFTGFGRTGSMFASEAVAPDIVTLSKALTGGTLPLAATIARRDGFRRVLVGSSRPMR